MKEMALPMTHATHFCPAKLNLYLEVHDRREDGFHDLGSLFQTLDYGDTLSAGLDEGLSLTGAEEVTPDPETNLILRAARLLLAEAQSHPENPQPKAPGMRFHIDKRLPAGAGLGGGSSDAAGALVLGNQLWGLDISPTRLAELAAQLGSDIPFFLHGGTAFVEGRGEKLQSAPAPYPFHVLVATPKVGVETAWAYRNLDAPRKRQWSQFKALYHIHGEDPGFFQVLHNDFEAPMLRHFPAIAELHGALNAHKPVKVLLSGSGASLFALFTDSNQAQTAGQDIAPLTRFQTLAQFME